LSSFENTLKLNVSFPANAVFQRKQSSYENKQIRQSTKSWKGGEAWVSS